MSHNSSKKETNNTKKIKKTCRHQWHFKIYVRASLNVFFYIWQGEIVFFGNLLLRQRQFLFVSQEKPCASDDFHLMMTWWILRRISGIPSDSLATDESWEELESAVVRKWEGRWDFEIGAALRSNLDTRLPATSLRIDWSDQERVSL